MMKLGKKNVSKFEVKKVSAIDGGGVFLIGFPFVIFVPEQ